ncbi:hypothetical protein OPKNFCMD_0467 [Methylobacterium crusticola]|uniref:Uncharacterized protein n=1 Tax=Methylobacterium crusticola TaxID=1697972 RepID=A0ABQ4QR28_9HYPH|nr:hypothetical protein [Methylobacterium crusticola]GJD47757.1 hypothetical protein OPKNFCMD_0467 [Methylobacterium crusticola]
MTRLRFSTALEVFDAFPTLRDDVQAAPTGDAPTVFLLALGRSGTPEDGVAFGAYVLGRRETVWWACQCVRLLIPGLEATEPALRAAEAWVYAPEEENRLAALRLGADADRRVPTTWLALAAGWSGGNIAPPGLGAVQAPPHYTARAARVAVLSGLAHVPARDRSDRLNRCLEGALRLMQPQDAP